MPYYAGLKDARYKPADRKRIVQGLQRLRDGFAEQGIPTRSATDTLLLATWNIREFDSGKYGPRSADAYYFIAEILQRFDLIALQEIKTSLYGLQTVRRLLGSSWDYVVTDVSLGTSGNAERMAFLYDTRKVTFSGLAAEVVLPSSKKATPVVQFARSPYLCGFKAGWSQINLCTVHIYYGKGLAVDPQRLAEIKHLANTLKKHAIDMQSGPVHSPDGDDEFRENLIALGDFNIFNRDDVTFEALTSAGFRIPDGLQEIPGSNVKHDKHYDQIAYLKDLNRMTATGKAGVFDFFEYVYRLEQDEALYAAPFGATKAKTFRDWRTYQMSDHLPMWCEFRIDQSDEYLQELLDG